MGKHFRALFKFKVLIYLSMCQSTHLSILMSSSCCSEAAERPYAHLYLQREYTDVRLHTLLPLTWVLSQTCASSGPAKSESIFQPLYVRRLKFTEQQLGRMITVQGELVLRTNDKIASIILNIFTIKLIEKCILQHRREYTFTNIEL